MTPSPFTQVATPDLPGDIRCITAGNYPSDVMRVNVRSHRCGDIEDGVGIRIGDSAGFVLAFADLERVYKAAVIARNTHE